MKRVIVIAALCVAAFSASAQQQPQRLSDDEINARFQVMTSRLTNEITRGVALEARLAVVEAELAKAKEDLAKALPANSQPSK